MEVKRESIPTCSRDAYGFSFNPCFDGSEAREYLAFCENLSRAGFNPCFDGSEARVSPLALPRKSTCCFNPCFDGSEARVWEIEGRGRGGPVSILVLMEVKRESNTDSDTCTYSCSFNPCFDGSEARASIASGCVHSVLIVSILVLMEVTRET